MNIGGPRFKYSGHAKGATAHFHRLDDAEGLNHVVPTLGESVLPETGERSEQHVGPYYLDVNEPRKRRLLSVDKIDTLAEGRERNGRFETEVSIDIAGLHVLETLHIDLIRLHMQSERTADSDPAVTTQGNRIEGMRLGNVEARVTLDHEPLHSAGTEQQLMDFHRRRAQELPKYDQHYRSSLVKEIELIGSEKDLQGMCVMGNVIVWKGFGKIILGEINVKGHERRLTLVRLAMGSSAAGTAVAGDGQSNGQPIVTHP